MARMQQLCIIQLFAILKAEDRFINNYNNY